MAGTLTISTLNDSSGVLATQNGMKGIIKAWVNFAANGTINASFNVSSVTVNTANTLYTINFTTAMPSATYVTQTGGQGWRSGSSLNSAVAYGTTPTTTSVQVIFVAYNETVNPLTNCYVSVFGN